MSDKIPTSTDMFTRHDPPVLFDHWVNYRLHPYMSFTDDTSEITSRSYGLSLPGDTVMLDARLQSELPHVRAHYRRIGMQVATTILWQHSTQKAQELCPPMRYDTWIYDRETYKVAPDEDVLAATDQLNNKNTFLRQCDAAGLTIPKTDMYDAHEVPIQKWDGPWFVKSAVSVSGRHIVRAQTWDEVLAFVQANPGPYQIQEALDTTEFLNTQYYVHPDGSLAHICTSEQVIEGVEHIGNRFPADYEVQQLTDPAARLVADMGYRGLFAFDVAMVQGTPYLLECNPRYNGATYPAAIAAKLGTNSGWTLRYSDLAQAYSVGDMNLNDLEYSKERDSGLVVIAWGMRARLGYMAIGTNDEQNELVKEFDERFVTQSDSSDDS
jgi:hypothetical protein